MLNNILKSSSVIRTQSVKSNRKYSAAPQRTYKALESAPAPSLTTVNNLKVVLQEKPESPLVTLGVTVEAGAVNETDFNAGISKFIAELAIDGPSSRTNQTLRNELRSIGAVLSVDNDRENTTYTARCFPQDVRTVIGILGDIVKNRNFDQRTMENLKTVIEEQTDVALENIEIMMEDHLHAAAFQGTPLERSIYTTEESLNNIDSNEITKYMDSRYTAPTMVLTAVGNVSQDIVLDEAARSFGSVPQTGVRTAHKTDFVGSEVRIRDDEVDGCNVIYALKGTSKTAENKAGFLVLQELLGSFDKTFGGLNNNGSALSEALATERLVNHYEAFNKFYNDVGIIGVRGSFTSRNSHELDTSSDFILKEFQRLGKMMSHNDLVRAQNNLVASALFRWSDDITLSKELGARALRTELEPLQTTINTIKSLTTKDIKKITMELDDTDPVIIGFGKTEDLPDYTQLRNRTYWTLW